MQAWYVAGAIALIIVAIVIGLIIKNNLVIGPSLSPHQSLSVSKYLESNASPLVIGICHDPGYLPLLATVQSSNGTLVLEDIVRISPYVRILNVTEGDYTLSVRNDGTDSITTEATLDTWAKSPC